MNTLLFQGSDHTLDHPILLRAVRRDELLFEPVASYQGCEASAGENQAIVRPKQEGLLYFPQSSKPSDQGLLKRGYCRLGFARTRPMQSQKFSGVAVDYQRQGYPAVSSRPDTAQICRPALVRTDRYRRQCLYPGSKANRALLQLPAADMKDPLNGVLVHVQEACHGSVARRGYSASTDRSTGAIADQRVMLEGFYSSQDYPEQILSFRFADPTINQTLTFLTNNARLPASTIAAPNKNRYQVELFFKWIKQHLRSTNFLSTSENAVKNQIWCAVYTYVMIANIREKLQLNASVYTCLQFFWHAYLRKPSYHTNYSRMTTE